MNNNTDTELCNILMIKRLIVFGIGNYFHVFCEQYPEFMEKIDFCIDNNYQGELKLKQGTVMQVYEPVKVQNCTNIADYVILFCSSYAFEMKQQIDSYLGIEYDYFEYPFYVTLMDKKIYKRIISPLFMWQSEEQILSSVCCRTIGELLGKYKKNKISVIPRLSIVLTTKCSLRCRDCNNLMGYFEHKEDLDKGKIIRSLERIMEEVNIIPCCELIGGEPFLAEGFNDVLSFLVKQDKVVRVEITTNGTVMNNRIEIDTLKNSKIVVKVSDYGNVADQKRFIDFMWENGICMEILQNMMWIVPGEPEKHMREPTELMKQYDRCYGGMLCKCLWEDKIFGCARAASLDKLGYAGEKQYVDIETDKKLKEEINRFLTLPFYEACDHCKLGLSNLEYVQPAIQL